LNGEITLKKLSELYDCKYDTLIKDIKINSKEIKPGDIFICTMGVTADRHDFIDEAINNGAAAIVVSKYVKKCVPVIKVENTNEELPVLSRKLYDYDDNLTLIGITGTDGKTTTTAIIRQMLGTDKCGFIGTTGAFGKVFKDKPPTTTPDSLLLYKYLGIFVKEGLKYAAMETSSEGFFRKRLESFTFDIGIFTNITRDHLNIHKTMENYINSKKMLFENIKDGGTAVLNMDDQHYEEMLSGCKCNVLTYGKNKKATLIIKDFKEYDTNTDITYIYNNREYKITSPLTGEYNIYNLAAAILTLTALGFTMEGIIEKISIIETPVGRTEYLNFGQKYKIILDYAHTPNALYNILTHLSKIKKGKIITITGSAGGREKEKRTNMGHVVQELSDLVIYTMDDPRYEKVSDIINAMIDNSKNNYIIIEDRKEAIIKAFETAEENDIVLIAGKGRDNFMAIEDKYIEYNDFDVIERYFK